MPVETYDLAPIASRERWLPLVPRTGFLPGVGARPAHGGNLGPQQEFALDPIVSGEAFGAPSFVEAFQLASIASGEAFGLLDFAGPFVGLGGIPSAEAWGGALARIDAQLAAIASGELWGYPYLADFVAPRELIVLGSLLRRQVTQGSYVRGDVVLGSCERQDVQLEALS